MLYISRYEAPNSCVRFCFPQHCRVFPSSFSLFPLSSHSPALSSRLSSLPFESLCRALLRCWIEGPEPTRENKRPLSHIDFNPWKPLCYASLYHFSLPEPIVIDYLCPKTALYLSGLHFFNLHYNSDFRDNCTKLFSIQCNTTLGLAFSLQLSSSYEIEVGEILRENFDATRGSVANRPVVISVKRKLRRNYGIIARRYKTFLDLSRPVDLKQKAGNALETFYDTF
ncbi:hypothetical protein PIB30_058235 [Stylosanthes scabra]|uniref:Uncharacterized protein n=1 Tax=Stylosanthes scabra TaxID=79078 RepID=A0ABU6VJ82_9FABA|nr:hypothetical protein [Stylosanthes scabra]